MLDKIRAAVAGKKTYLIAALVIAVGIAEGMGIDVPGVEVGDDPLGWILAGLGLTTLRRGVAKQA